MSVLTRRLVASLPGAAVAITTIAAGSLLWGLGTGAWARFSLGFFTQAPTGAGRTGGIAPMLFSTLVVVALALALAAPVGLGAALFLHDRLESARGAGRVLVRTGVDVLGAVPSIVFGMFGNALFVRTLGFGFSLLSGSLTLAIMIVPLLIRVVVSGLETTPEAHLQAGAALGLGRATMVRAVLLPAALPALVAGLVLGTARALAETAALLFTSGYADRMPASVWDSGRTLSVHIYDLTMNVPGGNASAQATAAALVLGVFIVELLASGIVLYISRGRSQGEDA
ncbi:MAG: ABC transporter permease subunit [Deltaproteobacteria bacterium]|nr:ABC transporter permease subunit [Deltaproteobacteria bacterium]